MGSMLYLDCPAGISGDMFVAAMVDLGIDQENLLSTLQGIPIDGFHVELSRAKKASLDVCDFNVVLDGDDGQAHSHRHLADVLEIIDATPLSSRANELAKRMFQIVAKAEAQAHGVGLDEVHFHEVGAIDSIVDIIAAAFCVDALGVSDVCVSPLSEGHGTVMCQHGIIPVPVPAVVNIAQAEGLSLSTIPYEGEFVTPTGAAIAAAIKTRSELPKSYRIVKSGMGGGKRDCVIPNVLRAFIIEADISENADSAQSDATIWKLETDIDDCSGEQLGFVMDLLFEAGAREVHYTPISMKKNRPGYQIEVVCDEDAIERIEEVLFMQTTTIGIRRTLMQRTVLERKVVQVSTPWGKVQAKQVVLPHGSTRIYPEYDSVAALSRETEAPFADIYHAAYSSEKDSL